MSKILMIDDDRNLTASTKLALTKDGFIVDIANCTDEAENMLKGFEYDLLILDWMMPGVHGIDYLQQLRSKGVKTPVLMLTGMRSTENKIAGLDKGADDYLTKPFNRAELSSRIKAILRRPRELESSELSAGGISLDTKKMQVTWHGVEVKVTKQEYQILELLMRNKDEVFSHDALVERAWSSMSESSPDTVRVHMSRLRKKFEGGPTPCPLRTVYGVGYILVSKEK